MMNNDLQVTVNTREIAVPLDGREPIIIPRAKLRTRLELLAWSYLLAGRHGMTLRHLRAFIAAMFRHHGWPLPVDEDGAAQDSAKDGNTAMARSSTYATTRLGMARAAQHV